MIDFKLAGLGTVSVQSFPELSYQLFYLIALASEQQLFHSPQIFNLMASVYHFEHLALDPKPCF